MAYYSNLFLYNLWCCESVIILIIILLFSIHRTIPLLCYNHNTSHNFLVCAAITESKNHQVNSHNVIVNNLSSVLRKVLNQQITSVNKFMLVSVKPYSFVLNLTVRFKIRFLQAVHINIILIVTLTISLKMHIHVFFFFFFHTISEFLFI